MKKFYVSTQNKCITKRQIVNCTEIIIIVYKNNCRLIYF